VYSFSFSLFLCISCLVLNVGSAVCLYFIMFVASLCGMIEKLYLLFIFNNDSFYCFFVLLALLLICACVPCLFCSFTLVFNIACVALMLFLFTVFDNCVFYLLLCLSCRVPLALLHCLHLSTCLMSCLVNRIMTLYVLRWLVCVYVYIPCLWGSFIFPNLVFASLFLVVFHSLSAPFLMCYSESHCSWRCTFNLAVLCA